MRLSAALLLLYILNALGSGKETAHPQLRRACLGLAWMHNYHDLLLTLLLRYNFLLPVTRIFTGFRLKVH